jgi:hypothetical protein
VGLVDDLLERADAHGGAAEVVDLGSILLRRARVLRQHTLLRRQGPAGARMLHPHAQ